MERFSWTNAANIVETGVKKSAVPLKGLQAAADLWILFQNRDLKPVFD